MTTTVHTLINAAVLDAWQGAYEPTHEAGIVLERLRAYMGKYGLRARKLKGRVSLPSGRLEIEVTTPEGGVVARTYHRPNAVNRRPYPNPSDLCDCGCTAEKHEDNYESGPKDCSGCSCTYFVPAAQVSFDPDPESRVMDDPDVPVMRRAPSGGES